MAALMGLLMGRLPLSLRCGFRAYSLGPTDDVVGMWHDRFGRGGRRGR